MNLLLDIAPTSLVVDGEEYKINAGFRESILFEIMMQDPDLTERDKIYAALSIYFPEEMPTNIAAAIDQIIWFYRCGKEEPEKPDNLVEDEEDNTPSTPQQIYSFEADDDYIYAAFLSQYGIDLQDIDFLHWWKFKAMFKSLEDSNKIVKIMEYRAMKIHPDMSKQEKDFYRSMKKAYALPDNRSEEEKERDFHNTLAKIF